MIIIHGEPEQVTSLLDALAAAQGKFEGAHKGTRGHGYKYADLESVWDSVKEPLSENGIFVSQFPNDTTEDEVGIVTVIAGKGAVIQYPPVIVPLPPENNRMNPPQRVGAALTYARRYALESVFCLSRVDDTDAQTPTVLAPEIAEQKGITVAEAAKLIKLSRESGRPISELTKDDLPK